MQPALPPTYVPSPPTRNPNWWWFLIPVLSFGLGSFVTVFLGGRLLKSHPHMYAAGGYLAADVFFFCGVALTGPSDPNAPAGTGATIIAAIYISIAWLGGTLHTVYLQLQTGKVAVETPGSAHSYDPAAAAAAWRASRRAEARGLLASNPGMA